jgi:7,8-dihydroneopterin aldolase/epimerase/oxygenase
LKLTAVTIFLQGFGLAMEIGIHPFELGRKQKVLVDVELDVAPDLDFDGDDVGSIVDYDFMRQTIERIASARRFNTQEAFCRAILSAVLERTHVLRATVVTRKPDVYPDSLSVGCRMTATKS